jgi:hypothetical protein
VCRAAPRRKTCPGSAHTGELAGKRATDAGSRIYRPRYDLPMHTVMLPCYPGIGWCSTHDECLVLQWSHKPHPGLAVPDAGTADGTRPRSDEATDGPLPPPPEATVISRAGGPASVAAMARRRATPVARAPSRPQVLASRRGLLREAERKPSWHGAEACGAPTPAGIPALLHRADGDAAAGRDALRTAVIPPREAPQRRAGPRRNRRGAQRAPCGRGRPSVVRPGRPGGDLPPRRVAGRGQRAGAVGGLGRRGGRSSGPAAGAGGPPPGRRAGGLGPGRPPRGKRSCGGQAAAGPSRAAWRRPRGPSAWSTLQGGPGPAGRGIAPAPWGRGPGGRAYAPG